MKRCSTCNRTYSDPNLSFCIDDGTPLTAVPEDESTVVSPSTRDTSSGGEWNPAPYQPPGTYVPPNTQAKRRSVWPWLVGLAAAFIVGIFALSFIALFFGPKLIRRPEAPVAVEDRNSNQPPVKTNTPAPANANSNTGVDTAVDVNTPAPTDHDQVLAQLTQIENDWTVANVKADKRALNRILADDYVGPNDRGYPQTKAEYLRNVQPQTIENWQFHDLSLELTGDRAKLTGRATFFFEGQKSELLFTDKFVWREGRWQATASQVAPVQ